jgi:hypothetical protein
MDPYTGVVIQASWSNSCINYYSYITSESSLINVSSSLKYVILQQSHTLYP